MHAIFLFITNQSTKRTSYIMHKAVFGEITMYATLPLLEKMNEKIVFISTPTCVCM